MAQPDPARPGPLWSTDGDDAEPVWEYEPQLKDITRVCQRSLNIRSDQCKVSFLDEGGSNKVYLVETHQGKYIMRVSLPVDPMHKVNAEVLVHQWLGEVTRVPVPEIYDYQSHSKNDIGFEWILMQYVPGQSAFYRWRKMDMAQKTVLVERIAECQADIISKSRTSHFRGIGSLERNGDNMHTPGRIVAIHFCQGDHYNYNLQRGPFRCSRDWLQTLLNIVITGSNREIRRSTTKEERTSNQHYLAVAKRLEQLVLAIFPTSEWEPTVLWHNNLSLCNIMLGKNNELESIIDWEFVSAMPLWVATRVPKFLEGEDRHEAPPTPRWIRKLRRRRVKRRRWAGKVWKVQAVVGESAGI